MSVGCLPPEKSQRERGGWTRSEETWILIPAGCWVSLNLHRSLEGGGLNSVVPLICPLCFEGRVSWKNLSYLYDSVTVLFLRATTENLRRIIFEGPLPYEATLTTSRLLEKPLKGQRFWKNKGRFNPSNLWWFLTHQPTNGHCFHRELQSGWGEVGVISFLLSLS